VKVPSDAVRAEIMDLLDEECHEVGVARSKVRRSGHDFTPYNNPAEKPYEPGKHLTNDAAWRTEVYDALTLIDMMFERGMICPVEYALHQPKKLAKLRRWAPGIFKD
jgi:hypothetical protein